MPQKGGDADDKLSCAIASTRGAQAHDELNTRPSASEDNSRACGMILLTDAESLHCEHWKMRDREAAA